ncbi:MAG: ABC transporter, partial [Gallionella sp.]|nr:ABC transporter [Gallionella sp.]
MRKFLQKSAWGNVLFALLLVSAVIGLSYFASQHKVQRDVTQNALNSLEPGSIAVLKQL